MIFLLDTNVISERTAQKPDAAVMDFLRAVPIESTWISSMVLAEVAQGVENNPTPRLKAFLSDALGADPAPGGTGAAARRGIAGGWGIPAHVFSTKD